MTSKEEKYEEWRRYFFEVDKEMYEYFTQDLERLEALKKENKKIRIDISNLNGSYLDISKENEKLKKVIEIMIREKIKPSAFLGILKDYQYHNKVDMPYEKVSIYLDCDLTQQEYELIKEVLGE
jgi:hypothetical protein